MGKTFNKAELAQLRKSAPANTKLSVSRPARLKKQRAVANFEVLPSNKVVRNFVNNHQFRINAISDNEIDYAVKRVNKFYDLMGRFPETDQEFERL